jgi:ABC-type branched-subunit amino acid transport system ATPase component
MKSKDLAYLIEPKFSRTFQNSQVAQNISKLQKIKENLTSVTKNALYTEVFCRSLKSAQIEAATKNGCKNGKNVKFIKTTHFKIDFCMVCRRLLAQPMAPFHSESIKDAENVRKTELY